MGQKVTIETVGDLRMLLQRLPNDLPLQFIDADGGDYRRAEGQSLYDGEEGAFVKLTLTD